MLFPSAKSSEDRDVSYLNFAVEEIILQSYVIVDISEAVTVLLFLLCRKPLQ